MGFGQVIVDLEGFESGSFSLGVGLLSGSLTVVRKDRISVGQAGVGGPVNRIFLDCLLKIANGFSQSVAGSLIPKISAFKIELMRLGIFGGLTADGCFFAGR